MSNIMDLVIQGLFAAGCFFMGRWWELRYQRLRREEKEAGDD